MKRCPQCFRYALGDPPFCPTCGRSFNVRICSRGHINDRGVTFCAECGSADLSTAAPAPGFLFRLSELCLHVLIVLTFVVVVLAAALGCIYWLDWSQITPRLLLLVLLLGLAYWAMTLLPGPVKKLGKAAGKHALKSAMNHRRKRR